MIIYLLAQCCRGIAALGIDSKLVYSSGFLTATINFLVADTSIFCSSKFKCERNLKNCLLHKLLTLQSYNVKLEFLVFYARLFVSLFCHVKISQTIGALVVFLVLLERC
jgi:hypothetical protein